MVSLLAHKLRECFRLWCSLIWKPWLLRIHAELWLGFYCCRETNGNCYLTASFWFFVWKDTAHCI